MATGLGIAVAGSIEALGAPGAAADQLTRTAGYGPLVPDPGRLLSLPEGFSYELLAEAGVTTLESGEPSPSDPDGSAVFADEEGHALVVNHEIEGSEDFAVPPLPGVTYDAGAEGGTTTIRVDASGKRVEEYVSLAGTHNNCAGGRTPWGTWLTCEETEQRAGGQYQKDHGFVFEVDPLDRAANQDPVPLRFLGRYSHEALAIDPRSTTIYLTEDAVNPHGGFYRWTPPAGMTFGKGSLRELALSDGGDTAGRLEAMRCTWRGKHIHDLSLATEPGTTYKVEWLEVEDRLATDVSVRKQFANSRVTRSRKLEGAYWGDDGAYFIASFARFTDGSVIEHDGQVWFYDPRKETVTLRTIFRVNPDPEQDTHYDGPDNIVVCHDGGLIVAEDGEGINHLLGVTPDGEVYAMARNDLNGAEFTGPTFSEDGKILFANIHEPGHVFAIRGPWVWSGEEPADERGRSGKSSGRGR